VYVGALDNFLYSVRRANGRLEWRWRAGGDMLGRPAADARRVYSVSLDNLLRAHDLKTGAQRWKRPLPFRPISGPAHLAQVIAVSGGSTVALYSAVDGSPIGTVQAPGDLRSPPHLMLSAEGDRTTMTLILLTDDVTNGPTMTALARALPALR
jgi:outer membrane protein assembly factor BamB